MVAVAPAATKAGTLSAAGEALHILPVMVARPWIWVEPIRLAASTTPGQSFFRALCSPSSVAGTAAPMRKPPAFRRDLAQGLDPLHIDHEIGLDEARFHPHQKIGAAGKHEGEALLRGQQLDRLVYRIRSFISHGCSQIVMDARAGAGSPPGRPHWPVVPFGTLKLA